MKNNETSNPVVVCSNHTGRAENPSKSPTQGDTREHGNTRVGPWVAAQELHGGSGDPSPSPGAAEPSREQSGQSAAVDTTELAETLRALLVASKRDRDASDNALCLLPEQDTEWPEGYDFEALEAAHDEELAARQSLRAHHDAAASVLARFDTQVAGGAK